MHARLLPRRGLAAFALLVVVAEVAGRSLTAHVDRVFHVAPLAPTGASYYPLPARPAEDRDGAGLRRPARPGDARAGGRRRRRAAARRRRARARNEGRRVSARGSRRGSGSPPSPRPRVIYLVQSDAEEAAAGRWPLLAPWLHTYALPVFAVLAVAVAALWRVAGWLYDVEEYAASDDRPGPPHPQRRLRGARLAPSARRRRRRRAAPPLRARVRVASSSASRLTRGPGLRACGRSNALRIRRRKWKHLWSLACRRPPPARRECESSRRSAPPWLAAGLVWGDPAALARHAAASARTGALVASDRAAAARGRRRDRLRAARCPSAARRTWRSTMLPHAEMVHWAFAAGILLVGLCLLCEAIVGEEVWRMRPGASTCGPASRSRSACCSGR